jgi:DNA-binding response OmpR family regulator
LDDDDPGVGTEFHGVFAYRRISPGPEVQRLSNVLVLSSGREPPAEILPSLSLLPHSVRVAPAAVDHVLAGPAPDAIFVDARRDLVGARRVLLALRASAITAAVIAIVTDGGWAAFSADWGADDLLLHTAGPGEVEARLRLAIGRRAQATAQLPDEISAGGLVVNEATYSARMNGRSLDLTFKEFELLKFLAQHPGRVFTRAQLLQEVWGYDYFGGTRTVDVHVRRLRAKLGAENEALIGTVRNVGYRFVPVKAAGPGAEALIDGPAADESASAPAADGAVSAGGELVGTRGSLGATFAGHPGVHGAPSQAAHHPSAAHAEA